MEITVISGKESAENGSASASGSVMNKRQNSLSGDAQFRRSVVGDVGASGGPDGRVSHTLNQLKGDDAPGFLDVGNVEEAQDAAQQTQTQHLMDGRNGLDLVAEHVELVYLDVANFADERITEEVSQHFRNVVDDRRHAEDGRSASVIL